MSPKVLLLEEDATFAVELQAGLRQHGFDVTLVREGGLGLARAVTEEFDLILLSAELPGMNGFRLCNRIKKDPAVKFVPVFMMSVTREGFVAHEQLPTRADSYFQKPILMPELVARARMHVPRRNTSWIATALVDPVTSVDIESLLEEEVGEPSEEITELQEGLTTPPPPLDTSERVSDLERELAEARKEVDAVADLRAKVAAHEEATTKLTRELAEARAAAYRPRPSQTLALGETELRAQVQAKEKALLQVKSQLAAEQQALASSKQALEQLARDRDAQSARAEKLQTAAGADKELWAKRLEEVSRRADRSRARRRVCRRRAGGRRRAPSGGCGRRARASARRREGAA